MKLTFFQGLHWRWFAIYGITAGWWGGLMAVSFGVVPWLFKTLPTPQMAGSLAATLFHGQAHGVFGAALLSLVCLQGSSQRQHPTLKTMVIALILAMLAALIQAYGVAPNLLAARNGSTLLSLRIWHGIGSGLILVQWVAGLVMLWCLTKIRMIYQKNPLGKNLNQQ